MSEEQSPQTPPTHGIFISKGMRVGVPVGGLTISTGGSGESNAQLVLHVVLDVTPHWLGIALSHLQVAEQEHPKLAPAWQQQANEEIARVLEAEFIASMQAMMAAAIAIDAFYAAVKERVPIPETTLQAWRNKGATRHKQVYEVLRRGFKIGKEALPKVREALKEIYRFRDLAVHPDPKLAQPLIHPALGIRTEWRFVYFRFDNAKPLVNTSLSLIVQLLDIPNDKNKDLKRYVEEMRPLMQPLVQQWESKYGSLYPQPDSIPKDDGK